MPFDKVCPQCGKEFIGLRSSAKYCSQRCGWDAKLGRGNPHIATLAQRPKKICEGCGKEFNFPPSSLKHHNRRFCSPTCFYEWLGGSKRAPRITIDCPSCGKAMEMLKSRYEDGRKHYCSQKCMMADRPVYRRHYTKGPTDIEQLMIDEMDARYLNCEYQYRLKKRALDFAFPEIKLAIEADGSYWHNTPAAIGRDTKRDADLRSLGWTVMRFDDKEIKASTMMCVDEIELQRDILLGVAC